MELKRSSPKSGGFSPPNCFSDPEEKEISDDDDDDRNHKHRRREARSQSLERDSLKQAFTQSYRKRNRPFENGQSDLQSQYNLDKFEKRRPTGVNFFRFSGEHGSGAGRGRNYQRDFWFGNIDLTSQIGHPGCIPSAVFSGRGLSNVSNAPSAPWNNFGLIPGIPNGTIDAINPLGMAGILRPQLNPSLNMGIQRQRCRDFEEHGFCLRGDMCPMEHGVNRIVIEDVQGLSQFNLPASLPNPHLLGTSPGSGFVPSVSVSSSTVINSRGDALNLDGAFSGAVSVSGADVYDPDQPLWNNNGHEASTLHLGFQLSNFDECESLKNGELSDHVVGSSGAAIGSQSTSSSVWGRLSSSKSKLELKEKYESRPKPLEHQESRSKDIHEVSGGAQATSYIGKQNNVSTFGPKTVGSTSKLQNDIGSNAKKPTQKAQRTLFVNCIPLKDNKKENLFSHFRKFGEVIDIYIPSNSNRAFVQFSRREEAERALKAPDAIMGSRFIKLWWANRDSIPDEGMISTNNVPATYSEIRVASDSPHSSVANKGKDNLQHVTSKLAMPKTPNSLVTAGNDSKSVIANGLKGPLPMLKKMGNLDLLKEELHKKQELLEQKRNEFRRQLDKLAKQATGVKSEVPGGQATKKVETSIVAEKSGKSAADVISGTSLQAAMLVGKASNVESLASQGSKIDSAAALHDPQSLNQSAHPAATSVAPFHMNEYKLDNRFTAFKICAPLPATLANDAALRDHFSLYGELSNVVLEELGEEDNPTALNGSNAMRNCSAHIHFASRHSAERAFLNGKSWHGHNLQFIWVTFNVPRSSSPSSGESSSAHSAEKARLDNTKDALGPSESNSSPPKSLNELSCDSSGSGGIGHSPVAVEEHSDFEVRPPDKLVSYIALEGDDEPVYREEEAAG